jgi:hypothetical protein
MLDKNLVPLVQSTNDLGDGLVVVKDTKGGYVFLLDFYECAEDYHMYEMKQLKKFIRKAEIEHLKYKLNHLIGREKR